MEDFREDPQLSLPTREFLSQPEVTADIQPEPTPGRYVFVCSVKLSEETQLTFAEEVEDLRSKALFETIEKTVIEIRAKLDADKTELGRQL